MPKIDNCNGKFFYIKGLALNGINREQPEDGEFTGPVYMKSEPQRLFLDKFAVRSIKYIYPISSNPKLREKFLDNEDTANNQQSTLKIRELTKAELEGLKEGMLSGELKIAQFHISKAQDQLDKGWTTGQGTVTSDELLFRSSGSNNKSQPFSIEEMTQKQFEDFLLTYMRNGEHYDATDYSVILNDFNRQLAGAKEHETITDQPE